jgi:acyl-CoA dehydrogenase
MMLPHRAVYDEEHEQFRETVRRFAASNIAPDFQHWEDAGIIDRSLWRAGGEAGLLCPQVPEEFGGAGGNFRHNAVVIEELSYSGFAGPATDFSVHNDVCCGYLLSTELPNKRKNGCRGWCPAKPSARSR